METTDKSKKSRDKILNDLFELLQASEFVAKEDKTSITKELCQKLIRALRAAKKGNEIRLRPSENHELMHDMAKAYLLEQESKYKTLMEATPTFKLIGLLQHVTASWALTVPAVRCSGYKCFVLRFKDMSCLR